MVPRYSVHHREFSPRRGVFLFLAASGKKARNLWLLNAGGVRGASLAGPREHHMARGRPGGPDSEFASLRRPDQAFSSRQPATLGAS